jgi:signal transduction histidine kinase
MNKLFKNFSRIDRKDITSDINIQGSGLGLYISREIITNHGGKIWAESEGRNRGSTFKFTIPILIE